LKKSIKDIESGIVGDILLKKLNVYSELGFDILQKRLVESSLLEDILMSKTGSVENIMRVLVEKRNIESIVDDDIVVKKLDLISELDSDILHKRLGIETNSDADILVACIKDSDIEADMAIQKRDVVVDVDGDINIKRINSEHALVSDIIQKLKDVEHGFADDIAILLCGGATVSCGVGISNKNKAISWSAMMCVVPHSLLELNMIISKSGVKLGYGMAAYSKLFDAASEHSSDIRLTNRYSRRTVIKPIYYRPTIILDRSRISIQDFNDLV